MSGSAGEGKSGIWVTPIIGGTVRQLRDDVAEADITPDGTLLAFRSRGEIWLMGVTGGEEPRVFAVPEKGYSFRALRWSRDGQRLAYLKFRQGTEDEVGIETRSRTGGSPTLVVSAPRLENLDWAPDGRIIYQASESYPDEASSNFWEIGTDPRTGRVRGERRRITNWAGVSFHDFNVSADGKQIAFAKTRWSSDVYVGELKNEGRRLDAVRRLTLDDRLDWPGAWTRDSKTILFYSDRNGNFDIFKQGIDDRTAVPVVTGPDEERAPQFSPDGSWVLYLAWSRKPGMLPKFGRLMRAPISGGPHEPVLDVKGYPGSAQGEGRAVSKGHPDFRCPSGRAGLCVLREADDKGIAFSAFDPVEGKKGELARMPMNQPAAAWWSGWDLSPDGSRIASLVDSLHCRVRIVTLRGGTPRDVVVNGWSECDTLAWSADGESLFVSSWSVRGSSLLHVALNGEAKFLRKAVKWFERPLPSPDGRYLAFGEMTPDSNAWIIADSR